MKKILIVEDDELIAQLERDYLEKEGFEVAIAFDGDTKHLVYNTSDIGCPTKGASEIAPRRIRAPHWKDARLVPGTVVAMRGWGRPTPGIFLSHDLNTTLENIKVHYAEGMGLLAQFSENITLE